MYTKLRQGSKKAVVVVRGQHCILTDPPEENPGGHGGSSITCAQIPLRSAVGGG